MNPGMGGDPLGGDMGHKHQPQQHHGMVIEATPYTMDQMYPSPGPPHYGSYMFHHPAQGNCSVYPTGHTTLNQQGVNIDSMS